MQRPASSALVGLIRSAQVRPDHMRQPVLGAPPVGRVVAEQERHAAQAEMQFVISMERWLPRYTFHRMFSVPATMMRVLGEFCMTTYATPDQAASKEVWSRP